MINLDQTILIPRDCCGREMLIDQIPAHIFRGDPAATNTQCFLMVVLLVCLECLLEFLWYEDATDSKMRAKFMGTVLFSTLLYELRVEIFSHFLSNGPTNAAEVCNGGTADLAHEASKPMIGNLDNWRHQHIELDMNRLSNGKGEKFEREVAYIASTYVDAFIKNNTERRYENMDVNVAERLSIMAYQVRKPWPSRIMIVEETVRESQKARID
ncbi:uncharacterized protein PAC_02467 [Phialocephala subalpina]|uniref:Uncharacterized protein n=1 Tax=Phialocephala subalpina TaxID=576137 RepID=A0A1L7WII6_9HELO|nr:uncharacterized protein PAC_02467 [Phialocephala subalpina]